MYAGPLRLVRALSVSTTCVVLSLAAHLLGTGPGTPVISAVSVVGLLVATLLLTLVLAALSGRRWTLGRTLVALALGQVGLHALFTVLLSSSDHHGPAAAGGAAIAGSAMASSAGIALAHGAAALLTGVGIAANDSALDCYFRLASSLVGSGIAVLSPWRQVALIPLLGAVVGVGPALRRGQFARWRLPRILTDLVLLQCLSRRGPPGLRSSS